MSIIYKTSDRIPLKIDDLEFLVSPFSYQQRVEILELASTVKAGVTVSNGMKLAALSMKYGIKSVKGLFLADGSEYKLSFDENGNLKDESVDDLFNIGQTPKLMAAMASLSNGIKPIELEGVELVLSASEKK